jgi:hypothetical protein
MLVVGIGRVQPDARRERAHVDVVGEARRPSIAAKMRAADGDEQDREKEPHVY